MSIKVYNLCYIEDLPKVIETGLSDISVSDMIDFLELEYQSELKKTLLADGMLAEKVRVSIDGRSIYDLETIIYSGSQLMFSIMLAGG